MARRLRRDEQALWARVASTVTPLSRTKRITNLQTPEAVEPSKAAPVRPAPIHARPHTVAARANALATLDGSWDKRLKRGLVQPEMRIDLHGHNLASAYAHLDQRLEEAAARGIRTLLLIAGKPRETGAGRGSGAGRGAIRAAVEDWLAVSRHASAIAAVRPAHPRHGGEGALYIVLRQSPSRSKPKS